MKMIKHIFITISVITLLSCNEKLPEYFGVYAVENNNLHEISPQKLRFKGNLMTSIGGLDMPVGENFNQVDGFIFYEQDLAPKNIKLTKLRFEEGRQISDLLSSHYLELNFWVAETDIEINVSPVDGKPDMYRVTPVQVLDKGFYAIHSGEMDITSTLNASGKFAHGFIIGSDLTTNNSSLNEGKYENIGEDSELAVDSVEVYENEVVELNEVISEQDFYESSEVLLNQVNEYFNNQNYNELRKMYINADLSPISDIEWNKLVAGFKNWSLKAGKIRSSGVLSLNYGVNFGTLTIQTRYEKAGVMEEEMDVCFYQNKYYITFIGSR